MRIQMFDPMTDEMVCDGTVAEFVDANEEDEDLLEWLDDVEVGSERCDVYRLVAVEG